MSPSKWMKFENNELIMDAVMSFEERKMERFTFFQHNFIEDRPSNLYKILLYYKKGYFLSDIV